MHIILQSLGQQVEAENLFEDVSPPLAISWSAVSFS